MINRRTFRILFALNLILIIVASLTPSSTPTLRNFDKVGHFAAYASLATLALFSFQPFRARLVVFLFAASLGIVIEWLQSFVPTRELSALDAVSNVAGLFMGIFVYYILKTVLPKQRWIQE